MNIWPKLLFICLVFLSGCDPFQQPDTMAEIYVSRLAYQLDETIPASDYESLMLLPSVRERRFDIPNFSVSLLDFLSLYGCELQVLVAERNSILGRYASPMIKLDYDLKFIAEAKRCINSISTSDDELKNKLTTAILFKQKYLPKVMWNALWADKELPSWVGYASGLYPLSAPDVVSEQTLEKVNEEVQQTLKSESGDLKQLKRLFPMWLASQEAGQLLQSLHFMTKQLHLGTALIDQRLERKPMCYQQSPTPKSKQLEQFFFNIYIGHMQPYIAQLHQRGEVVLPFLYALATITDAPSEEFSTYRQNVLSPTTEKGLWQSYVNAVSRHTQAWQRLLDQCGLRPSG